MEYDFIGRTFRLVEEGGGPIKEILVVSCAPTLFGARAASRFNAGTPAPSGFSSTARSNAAIAPRESPSCSATSPSAFCTSAAEAFSRAAVSRLLRA